MESSGTGAVIEPLLTIEREDLTGVLEFEARQVRTTIHAVAGEIVFAEGGTLGEALGRLLLRCQRLSEEHFGAVIRRMTDALSDDKVIRFGEVVVEYGFLGADDLDLALTQQVREKLMGCIHRGAGQWRFTTDSGASDAESSISHHVVRTRPTLVEAARQLSERRIEQILRLEEHRFPEIVAPERVIAAEFELAPEETAVLLDLNGTSSLHFILPKAASPHVASLIAALVLGGGVELRTTPSAGPAPRGDARPIPPTFMTLRRAVAQLNQPESLTNMLPRLGDPEITGSLRGPLGLPSVSEHRHSQSTVAARRTLDRRLSRESLTPDPPQVHERTRRAFERLRSDLELRKPTSDRRRWPEPMDERERRLMAESAFHRGRLYLRAEEAERALPGLSRAHELRPAEREYELNVKWAQMLVNDTFKDDRRRGEMQDLAVVVVREDPWCELAFSILGHCAFHDGKEEAALRFFQRAAHLDPKRLDASRLTDLLAGRRADNPRMMSKPDLRSRARGELRTLLDEIVPQLMVPPPATPQAKRAPTKGAATLRPAAAPFTPEDLAEGALPPERQTPFGGLEVSDPAPLPPSSRRSVAPAAGSPPAPSIRSLPPPSMPPLSASRPLALPSLPPPSLQQASLSPAPAPTPASAPPASPAASDRPSVPSAEAPPGPSLPLSPWRIAGAGSVSLKTQPLRPIPLAATASPVPPFASPPAAMASPAPALAAPNGPDLDTDPDLDPYPPRPRSRLTLAIAIAALSAIGALFYVAFSPRPATPTPAPLATQLSAPTELPTLTQLPTPTPTQLPTPTPEPPAAASVPPASSKPDSARTGVLRAPRSAYGRRIYVDGHIIGEGGRDLTAPCGAHRVRVGSTGTERPMTIPCGATLEL